ncbi:MAG: hypothetical protein HUJ26_20310 [Planctomycetaceae bacterium]|nr:hypothetical protein [Planctomycetaceae bacterium]
MGGLFFDSPIALLAEVWAKPEQAKELREMLGISQEWVDEMFAVLDRSKPSETMMDNLWELLTDAELTDHRDMLYSGEK